MTEHPQQDKQAELRDNEAYCLRVLAACRRFAVKLGGAAGNYATFAQHEEVLLQSFHDVVAAHQSEDGSYDQLLTQRCQHAGLTPVDMRNLQVRWQSLQASLEASDPLDDFA
jgi:hypothetical protein